MSLTAKIQHDPALPSVTLAMDGEGKWIIPESAKLFGADFHRSGSDLVLVNEGAADIRIPGYFLTETPADLFDANGAVIRGGQVILMAGPIAPAQYAEAGASLGANPIGQVETLQGTATVQRVDGTVETLQVGAKVFQQDVLQTETGASLSVTFVDGTIFTLASGSRMVIDELIFDPNANDNSGAFSLIQGSFVFIAGQVAKTGDMEVSTPSSTMGIRGTTVAVEVSSDNGIVTSVIKLAQDITGEIGKVELRDIDGNLIANIEETNTKWVVQSFAGGVREVLRDAQDDLSDSILIAEAFAAFRNAMQRVNAGDTFVSLSDPAVSQTIQGSQVEESQNLDVDAIDEQETIAPLEDLEQAPETDLPLPLDEGLNQRFNDDQTIIVVQGVEDADEESAITGNASVAELVGLQFAIAQGPANGTASLQPDGTFAFVPNPDFNGRDTFTFTASDAKGLVARGTVVVDVLPVNDAPVASDAATTVLEDSFVSGTVAASDIDGDTLTYGVTGLPASGEVLLFENGNFTYSPKADFFGTDSFTVTVMDPSGATALSTISVTILPQADAPRILTPVDDLSRSIIETDEEQVVSGVLAATDVDPASTLVWSGGAAGKYGVFAIDPAGAWSYTLDAVLADALAEAEVASEVFTATVMDETGRSQSISIPITITGTGDAPVIVSGPEDASKSLTEGDELASVSGKLEAIDPDLADSVVWSGTSLALFGVFSITPDGDWSYTLDNRLADSLAEGEVIVETFLAVARDASGAATPLTVEVSVTGTNDAPLVAPVTTFRAIEGTLFSGALDASDLDGPLGALTFALGSDLPDNGTAIVNLDGTFSFSPDAGFVGIETFEYTVTDANGAVTSGVAKVLVQSDPDSPAYESVSLGLSLEATSETAAGAIEIGVMKTEATSINIAIALDRSGSIGAAAWSELLASVETSILNLVEFFEGSDTDVDVQIITFASDVRSTPAYDLLDPALIAAIDPAVLGTAGGATRWDLALKDAGEFFFSEPSNELNFLLFVTDGIPSSGAWVTQRDFLLDPSDDYDVTIDAFGYGRLFVEGTLDGLDDDPVTFTDPDQLSDAFATSPVFNPDLIGFTIQLEADDGEAIDIASYEVGDALLPGLIVEGTNFELPLASIENIAELLGISNRINMLVQFDLDNDLSTAEVTLFNSEIIGKATDAQVLTGLDRPDLLFGSDAADVISGGGAGDVILGYGGNDTLTGGTGADVIMAGAGDDRIVIAEMTESGDKVDGGEGRDVLAFEALGEINAMIAALEISGIEVLDMDNALANDLALTVDELIGLSTEDDTELLALLDDALPNTRTILGDGDDSLAIDAQGIYSVTSLGIKTDGAGNDLNVLAFADALGNPLATIGVDTDIEVSVSNVITG